MCYLGGDYAEGNIYCISFSPRAMQRYYDGETATFQYFFSLKGAIDNVPESLVPRECLDRLAESAGFRVESRANCASAEMTVPPELRAKMRLPDTEMNPKEKEALSVYECVVLKKI